MKANKYILYTICLSWLSIAFLQAQKVGINTTNPQKILHIDGASKVATTNPVSGVPTAAQALDDVTINTFGNIGIGVADAQTKLEIRSDSPGAIRIEDGSQAEGRVLFSDISGNTSWEIISGSWYALLRNANLPDLVAATNRQYTNFASAYSSNSLLGQVDASAGTVRVPYTGTYRIIVSGNMYARRSATPVLYGGNFNIYKNGANYTTFMVSGYSYFGSSFSGISTLYLNKNDVISLYVDETGGVKSTSQTSDVIMQVIYIGK